MRGVHPPGLDDQGHGLQGQPLDLVDARAHESPAADDHGRGAVEQTRDDEGLVGAAGHHPDVETHLGKSRQLFGFVEKSCFVTNRLNLANFFSSFASSHRRTRFK